MHQWNILACNRNGDRRRNRFYAHNLFKHHHISCIQESSFPNSHAFKYFQAQVNAECKNYMFVNDRGTASNERLHGKHGGVCTILHADFFGVESATHMTELDVPDRYMVVRVEWGQTSVYIHNRYAPVQPPDRAEFFESLPRAFERDSIHIICGDLNSPLNPTLDSRNATPAHHASHQAMLQWTWDLEVVDPWRIHNPDIRSYSGPGRVNRLDYILVSHSLQEKYFHSARYSDPVLHNVTVSDHLLPSLTLMAVACEPKAGPWRAVKWMLDDPNVQNWILTFVKAHMSKIERAGNPGLAWQRLKRALRTQLMQRQQSYTQPSLVRVRECEAQLDAERRRAVPDVGDLHDAETALASANAEYDRVKADIRFKRDLIEGESGSSYFFRPPTNSLNRSPICTARKPTGAITTIPWQVRHYHWKFWGSVFGHEGQSNVDVSTDESVSARGERFSNTKVRVTDEDRDSLDSDLTVEEFVTAIKSMNPYKAPGHDGIPAKIYQIDPTLFARILVYMFDYQARRGILLPDQRRSIVCLLFKKGDRSEPANYRPISLIPVDLKIFARVLTNRLRPLMPPLIHRDQAGFIKGRHIQHTLLTMYDLQETVTELGAEAYATMIDFEKAYDRVNWEYLWSVLRHFGFGERFVHWVRLMYTSPEVQLNVNGHILESIRPSRGVKQGNPLSPLLFVLAMEPLCCAIRKRADLGLHLLGLPPVTGMYFADDVTLLSDSLVDAQQQLDIVQLYCAASGAKLNIDKTTILPLNRTQTQHEPSRLRVLEPDASVRYLGLPVGQRVYHSDRLTAINAKFFAQFSIWKWRAKTLQGRIVVARTLMASQLWYCSSVTCIPLTMMTNWQRALNKYIIRAQTEPSKGPLMITSEWLYSTPERTTLCLPNVERFTQRQWLNTLQQLARTSEQCPSSFGWYSIPLRQLTALQPPNNTRTSLLDFLWMPLSRRYLKTHPARLTSWWVDVMATWDAWAKTLNIETLPPRERQQIYLTAPFWNNKYPLWRYQAGIATRAPRSLWETSNPLIRRSLARSGLSTLQDFLTPDLRWPTLDVFAATVYCATELPDPQGRNITFLHHQLTQIFDRLFPRGVDTTLIEMPHTRLKPLMPWHASTPLKRHWFPLIPSKVLGTTLATTTAPPKTRHPLQRHVLTDAPSATQLHDHANNLRKSIDPRTLDVTLRIWWRILPTHYFFWRQHSDPNLRYCAHGCNAIETYRHLFWECQHCSELWNLVLRQWRPALHHAISWNQALFGLDLPLKSRWHLHRRSVLLAWNITRSIVFTILWQNRNQRKHQHEPPPDARTQWHWVDSRRRLHIRHALRQAILTDDTTLRDGLVRISSIFALSPTHYETENLNRVD